MNESVEDLQVHDRALRLFRFLQALIELRSKTIRSLDQYEKVVWLHKIPQEHGCYCVFWRSVEDEEQSDTWIEIKKPRLKEPPLVPDVLKPWLNLQKVKDSSGKLPPKLRRRIIISAMDEKDVCTGSEGRKEVRDRADCTEIKSIWKKYIIEKWRPWAEEDRRLQAVQEVYTELFSIYQKQQRLGEAYEVLLGIGYLTWSLPKRLEIKRHIIAAQTSLTFDAARGVIRLGPAGEGAKLTIEQDMLEAQDRPDATEQKQIELKLKEIGDTIWDGNSLQDVLQAWVHAVSPRGLFDNNLIAQKEITSDPRINLAPAVILRKRTERGLLRVFQEIIDQLEKDQPVPAGVKRLVAILDDVVGRMGEKEEPRPDIEAPWEFKEIYFPLPANQEQLEIVRQISTRQGILVQGPPGTGKSHSITNLVCHLLANGQRVLVTSHTARALRVLREKFPKEISDLCVMLLGDDLTAMQSLEDSVRGITDRYNNWDEKINRQRINELEKELDKTHRTEAITLNQLRAIREQETFDYPLRFGTYKGTAQAIASRLRLKEPFYSWMVEKPYEGDEPPLSDDDAKDLIKLMREIDNSQEEELTKLAIDPNTLVSPDDFIEFIKKEKEVFKRYLGAETYRAHPGYFALTRIPRDRRVALSDSLSDLLRAYDSVSRHIQPWVKDAATQILADRDRAWRVLLTSTRERLKPIGDRARWASEQQISGLGGRDHNIVRKDALTLLQHLESGGRLGFWIFRPKVVKNCIYLIKEVRIDGHLCNEPQPLQNLIDWIDIAGHFDGLRKYWSPYTKPPSGPFYIQEAEYKDLCEPLEMALALHEKVNLLKKIIAEIPGITEPTWHDLENVQSLKNAAEAVALEEEYAEAQSMFKDLEKRLRVVVTKLNVHPVVLKALEAVIERDERSYGEAYQILCDIKKSLEKLQRRDNLLNRLKMAAPALACEVKNNFADNVWDKRMAQFTAAWNWARADRWLKGLSDPSELERLSIELENHRRFIRKLICQLAAAKAWGHCFSRLTESERQHLMAWTYAVRRIGKGTGKYASMHRKAAREHMEKCRSAIPAWIMPIYRVAETVRPGIDAFDMVIVDEASQSGPEALFLQYLAKKIVIVGDDKQISPDFVGISREDVEILRQRYIKDLPQSDALGVDNSFFDQAAIRYGGRIRLREHFRCMPEIIQFSNNLCYRSEPLIPLRQYGSGRLTPVIQVCYINNGYQKGHSPRVVNPPEAYAIAEQISKLCNDPAYDGKTMGVISLLGEDQARLIEKLLLEKIGPEEMEKRHLICGNAYAFQGDERDIMFHSLVSAPTEGQRIGTLASPSDERRFNVAASRAKDQMWLFHSATLNDLSHVCLRYKFLEYCMKPRVEPTIFEGLNIEELRRVAQNSDRERTRPPEHFQSWFEVVVFLKIAERGYRVIPQYEIAGYRIDLVVEGMQGRLAVECDGDIWHGANKYEEDMARQRQLERCGWTFWRLQGSAFYRDPDAALEGLWSALDRLGIWTCYKDMGNDFPDKAASKNNALEKNDECGR